MKNEMEIKDDVYHFLKGSDLVAKVSGKLSKTERPDDSDREDVVISLLTPNPNLQLQEVYLNVNVYVADIKRGNHYEENTIRLRELMTLCDETFKLAKKGKYFLKLDTQKSYKATGKNEHFINNKILYKICNE